MSSPRYFFAECRRIVRSRVPASYQLMKSPCGLPRFTISRQYASFRCILCVVVLEAEMPETSGDGFEAWSLRLMVPRVVGIGAVDNPPSRRHRLSKKQSVNGKMKNGPGFVHAQSPRASSVAQGLDGKGRLVGSLHFP
jgi:hypothetical protein